MSFEQVKFLGASVTSFTAAVGWNDQTGSLNVSLVEDTSVNDDFSPPPIGSPVYFEFNDFKFGGLLQSWEQLGDSDGNPTYVVVVNDPREIVEGTQLILDGYSGTTLGVKNIFNCYGYLESFAFGNAAVNEAGMPWYLILRAVDDLVNTEGIFSSFGGPGLHLKDATYLLDLSRLPVPPRYYRIGGGGISLLDAISQLCQDAGCDYFVRLEQENGNNVIRFYTVSRRSQPPLGQIAAFIQGTDGVSAKSLGQELRNEITTTFLVGGPVCTLYLQEKTSFDVEEANTIWPFWGFDFAGNAVIGRDDFTDDGHTFAIDTRMLNVMGVGASYETSVGEMRAAIAGEESWRTWVGINEPDKAIRIGITPVYDVGADPLSMILQGMPINPSHFVNQAKVHAVVINSRNIDPTALEQNIHNLYEFISGYANEHYGRKFMVRIPFVAAAIETETGLIKLSQEPTEGGWREEGSLPLGLPKIYEDLFTTQDGRFTAFIRVGNASTYDLSQINPTDGIVVNDTLFLRVQVEPYVVFTDQANVQNPRVIITLPGPINLKPDLLIKQWFEGLTLMTQSRLRREGVLAQIEEMDLEQKRILAQSIENGAGGFHYVGMAPRAIIPDFAAVPLRSNLLTYGPWWNTGPTGKVRFEIDESLVPWNYGGYDVMNLTARAKVMDAVTNMQIGEMGSINVPGSPTLQIGDALKLGGPNITNIDVSFGQDGVTTNYRMRTYTPKFGAFSKQNADRFGRIARQGQQLRRQFREFHHTAPPASPAFYANRERAIVGFQGSRLLKGNSPHDVLVGSCLPGTGDQRQTMVSNMTFVEALGSVQAHNDTKYQSTALMSLDGLLRPYSVDTENVHMGHFEEPDEGASHPTVNDLNPFVSGEKTMTDISFANFGDTYPNNGADSLSSKNDGWDGTKARGLALRGPIIITGWGYDIAGKPVPNQNPDDPNDHFEDGYRFKPENWKTGPLDTRWDDRRKVWVAGGGPELGVVIALSGNMDGGENVGWNNINEHNPEDAEPYPRPRYVIRRVDSIVASGENGGRLIYSDTDELPPMSTGSNDFFAFNIQEGKGDLHTVGEYSPVLVYTMLGTKFFSELPRSFARQTFDALFE